MLSCTLANAPHTHIHLHDLSKSPACLLSLHVQIQKHLFRQFPKAEELALSKQVVEAEAAAPQRSRDTAEILQDLCSIVVPFAFSKDAANG